MDAVYLNKKLVTINIYRNNKKKGTVDETVG
jgi:hypothetical protein